MDINAAVESVDAENIIIDLKNNGGGDSSFVTEGLCSAVFDKEGGEISTAVYPKNDVYCANGWESYIKQIELEEQGITRESEGDYAYRQLCDDTLLEALRLIDGE